jgi:adenylate cyclase
MRGVRVILFFVLPFAAAAVAGVLGRVGALAPLDGRAYDRQIALRPGPPVPRDILLVDIDAVPGSLAALLADGLVTLKEMGARTAVLDLPLAQKSAPALDPSVLRQTLPNALDTEFSQMEENIQSLFDAIRRGSVRPRDAARYVSDLVALVAQAKGRLFSAAMGIARDDDARLGQAAAFFGRVYVPLELLPEPDPTIPADLADLALQRQSLSVLVRGRDPSSRAAGIRPAVMPLVNAARGGGFPSDGADTDGVRRRTRLLWENGGQHMGQLAFAAALDLISNPSIEASEGQVILRGAALPGRPPAVVTIPLTESGAMLLAWPRGFSGDGFRHLSWSEITLFHQLEDSLVSDLRDLDSHGYLTYLRSPEPLLDVYEEAARLRRGMLASGADSDADPWRATRERFFTLCDQFLGGDAEARILADSDRQLQSGALSDQEKAFVRTERDRVPGVFADARQIFTRLQQVRGSLQESLAGSFCIVSQETGTAASPGARTPFESEATDARASAALVCTLLSGRFLREASAPGILLLAAVLSLALAAALFRLKPFVSQLVGLASAPVAAAALGAVFVLYGLFVPPSLPVTSLLMTGIVLSSVKLAWKRSASRAVRSAFAGRVSAEGLRVMEADRGRLATEGSRRQVTVLCLVEDVSAGGPHGDPRELVRRLRTHRAAIGEAVVGLDGMLVESGARITAAFGAPLDNADHARRACLAALRARALERELNVNPPSAARAAVPEFSSRIGIHTGDAVTGFLGPGGLPIYGLVGSATDVSALLCGLNERFGTSILVTESVREQAGPGFTVRTVGTVAAGRQESLRVYELLAERDGPQVLPADVIGEFEAAVARFERGEVAAASRLFQQVLSRVPGDGPSAAYLRRCRRRLEGPGRPDPTSSPR